ncbi:MAG TPA: nicotinate-nucleotide--dimethylbenzimidazole phosphoribosyltransferase [Thermoanaerobaculia bacterium]
MRSIDPPDETYAERARARQRELTKPPGSLGQLEFIAVRLAAIQRQDRPASFGRRVVVFAASHGVVAEGVSAYPAEVTVQMVKNFARGGAAINALAQAAGADVVVVDAGVERGTRNFAREPAMAEEEMRAAMELGREEARRAKASGIALLGTGEMGIGNTTAASAITAALTGVSPSRVTGPGTGLDEAGCRRKIEVVERALALHRPSPAEPLELLRTVGGFEIAALAGLSLEAAGLRMAVVVDGFIASAAFAIAAALDPAVLEYAFFSHLSAEPGHRALLRFLRVEPLLYLDLRLGEGTGAARAMPVLGAAAAAHNEMATFADAGVSGKS